MLTLVDLNNPTVRTEIQNPGAVMFQGPDGVLRHVVPGEGLPGVRISVGSRNELTLAVAAVHAIRGGSLESYLYWTLPRDEDSARQFATLSETITQYWARGLSAPWGELLGTRGDESSRSSFSR